MKRFTLLPVLPLVALLVGCAGTPQQQADKAHQLYVQGLQTADQLVLAHKVPPATEKLIRDQLIPDAHIALTVVDASVSSGGLTFKTALDAFYAALERLAIASQVTTPTTKASP